MWTAHSVAGEVARNLRGVHIAVGAVLATILLWAGQFEAASVSQGVADLNRWLDRGGMVFSVEREGGIPGNECVAAAGSGSVLASGGAATVGSDPETVNFDRSPGVEYSVIAMTRGAVEIVGDRGPPAPGWIVGQTALEELGVGPGMELRSGAFTDEVAAAIGLGERQLGYDRDVIRLVPAANRRFAICWVELEPSAFGSGPELIAGLLPYDDAVIRPFLRTEPSEHPTPRYQARPSRFAWVAAGLAVGLFWGLWYWIRRRELALYRSLHLSRSGVAVLAAGEAVTVTGPAAVLATVVLVVNHGDTSATALGAWTIGAAALLGAVIANAAAWLIARRNLGVASRDV